MVAGTVTPGVVSGDSDILVLRVGDDGVIAWGKYVAYDQDEFAGSVKVDDSQNIVLTGYTGDNGTSAKNLIVVKLDGNGNLINDVVIRDPNLQYGLYGLDIVQTFDQEAYIIAGTGVQNATEAAPKYAFVLRIDYGLDNIRWAKIYRSNIVTPPTPPGPTNYDSFNHILRIRDHFSFGECYLLSGSGATPTGQQMTANDLIDPTGLILWANPSNYGRPGSNYDFPATTALYNELTNRFYVLHPDLETGPALLELVGSTGVDTGPNANQITIINFNYILQDMAWADPESKEEIALSGYNVNGLNSNGRPMFMKVDISGGTPPFPFDYTFYNYYFKGSDLQGIPFDFIVKPFNRGGGFYNQIYYHPKSLVLAGPEEGYRFTNPLQLELFGLNLLKTDENGGLDDTECFESFSANTQTIPMVPFPNFDDMAYSFEVVGEGAMVYSAKLLDEFVCGEPKIQAKPSMDADDAMKSYGIDIYPNPASNFLYISGLSVESSTITLYDLQGKKVLSKNHQSGNEAQLNVSTLESGLYFLKVSEGGERVFVGRVILR